MENKIITFKEYQQKALDLYEEIYLIFDSLDIRWWVHSGTLLGIIRHENRMIPWDDDIDMMITIKAWRNHNQEIIKRLEEKCIYTFDFYLKLDHLSSFPFIKFVSKERFLVKSDGLVTSEAVSPFVDLFLSCPSAEFTPKEWNKVKKWHNIKWIFRDGFNRCLHYQNSRIKKNLLNLLTYPIKLFASNEKASFYTKRAEESKDDWKIVRRFDKWSYRKNCWDLKHGLIETKIENKRAYIAKNYKQELKEEFGSNWNIEKREVPHIFKNQKNFKRDIYISDFIDKEIWAEENEDYHSK